MTFNPFDAEQSAHHHDGVLDLVATIVLRCGGVPHRTVVAVMFGGEEDLTDHHALELMDTGPIDDDTDPKDIAALAEQFIPQLRRTVAASRAERIALVTFDVPVQAAQILTGHAAVTLQLPAQRVAVNDEGWADLDDEESFGDVDEVIHSRAATNAVLAGLPFPAREFER